jgi:hypothetical protein
MDYAIPFYQSELHALEQNNVDHPRGKRLVVDIVDVGLTLVFGCFWSKLSSLFVFAFRLRKNALLSLDVLPEAASSRPSSV